MICCSSAVSADRGKTCHKETVQVKIEDETDLLDTMTPAQAQLNS